VAYSGISQSNTLYYTKKRKSKNECVRKYYVFEIPKLKALYQSKLEQLNLVVTISKKFLEGVAFIKIRVDLKLIAKVSKSMQFKPDFRFKNIAVFFKTPSDAI